MYITASTSLYCVARPYKKVELQCKSMRYFNSTKTIRSFLSLFDAFAMFSVAVSLLIGELL